MKQEEFLARVRERGEYTSAEEAERVTAAVLGVLGSRIPPDESKDLAAQLPGELGGYLDVSGPVVEAYGVEEFCQRVGDRLGTDAPTGAWHASAVLGTVAAQVSGGELNQLISVLPSAYATLFGKSELGST